MPLIKEFIVYSAQDQGGLIVVPVGPRPLRIRCPHCQLEITTKVTPIPGIKSTTIGMAISSLFCCCCLCFLGLIPCCINKLCDVIHSCPLCNSYIGRYVR